MKPNNKKPFTARHVVAICLMILFFIISPTNSSQWQHLNRLFQCMESFIYVDEIVITSVEGNLTIRETDIRFDEVKNLLNPFPAGAIFGIAANERRHIQRTHHQQFARISYFVENRELLTVRIYTFLSHPNLRSIRPFLINGYFAFVLIEGTDYAGHFEIEHFGPLTGLNWQEVLGLE